MPRKSGFGVLEGIPLLPLLLGVAAIVITFVVITNKPPVSSSKPSVSSSKSPVPSRSQGTQDIGLTIPKPNDGVQYKITYLAYKPDGTGMSGIAGYDGNYTADGNTDTKTAILKYFTDGYIAISVTNNATHVTKYYYYADSYYGPDPTTEFTGFRSIKNSRGQLGIIYEN
jgi:hypothetical protein